MPNVRSKKKMMVGGYVNYKLKRAIEDIALEEDISATKVLELLLKEGVEHYKVTGSFSAPKPSEEPPKK